VPGTIPQENMYPAPFHPHSLKGQATWANTQPIADKHMTGWEF
jgi:hypothetical protein